MLLNLRRDAVKDKHARELLIKLDADQVNGGKIIYFAELY